MYYRSKTQCLPSQISLYYRSTVRIKRKIVDKIEMSVNVNPGEQFELNKLQNVTAYFILYQ